MRRLLSTLGLLAGGLMLPAGSAVAQAPAGHEAHAAPAALDPALAAKVNEVAAATQQYRDFETARAAGYAHQQPVGCIETPEGAQGYHWLNPDLVDTTVDPLQPELVMYEPQADGSMKLIGVDYIVPFVKWTASEPPTLFGMPLGRNEKLEVFAIHIWTERPNPSGTFAMFNPSVSCKYAK
jgi:hypothetical protein